MLELDGLRRRYGDVVALDGLTLTVPPGQVFGLLGPNGAGKTTAMRAVFGLTALDAGEVRWDGRPVTFDDRRRFGYMPEERGLYGGMQVDEQVAYFARLHGLGPRAAARAAAAWLERLGLGDRSSAKVEELSLGNQQRVQLAVALVHEPAVLILDEPFSGLDPVAMAAMSTVLAGVAATERTVVFSSHQLDLVEGLCDAVAIVSRGRVVAAGELAELTGGGPTRFLLEVEGSQEWLGAVPGVRVLGQVDGFVRVEVDEGVDHRVVVRAAADAGSVGQVVRERRRLSEVFHEAIG